MCAKSRSRSAGKQEKSAALVLSGGGARGAYEAGVLRYIFETMLRRHGAEPRFEIFTGTSAGALNACYLASNADEPEEAVRNLVDYWQGLTMEKVLRLGLKELKAAPGLLFGAGREAALAAYPRKRPAAAPHPPVGGIFDTSPLQEGMRAAIPCSRMDALLEKGVLKGIALCATEVCTGKSIIFYDTYEEDRFKAGYDPSREPRKVRICVEHAMASAAIPFLFPAVQVDSVCYLDGALRQNTPLDPAIRLGAGRILVISLDQEPEIAYQKARSGCRRNPYPGALFLLGRVVSALMTQRLDYDLKRIEMVNGLIDAGTKIYGERFAEELNGASSDFRKSEYRTIRTCHIRPSKDPMTLAVEAFRESPGEITLPGLPKKIGRKLLTSEAFMESEFLSYLMFIPSYIQKLVDLGHEDAERRRDDLLAFFGD